MLETLKIVQTRKSSCVNARGTPPAVQEVLAVLLCLIQTWSGGVPGVPPGPGMGYPPDLGWGTP